MTTRKLEVIVTVVKDEGAIEKELDSLLLEKEMGESSVLWKVRTLI